MTISLFNLSDHSVAATPRRPYNARAYANPIQGECVRTNKALRSAIWWNCGHGTAKNIKIKKLIAIQGANCRTVTGQSTSQIKARGKMGKRGRIIQAKTAREAMQDHELLAMTMIEAAQTLFIKNQQAVQVGALRTLGQQMMQMVHNAV